jgi:hypothetical protein
LNGRRLDRNGHPNVYLTGHGLLNAVNFQNKPVPALIIPDDSLDPCQWTVNYVHSLASFHDRSGFEHSVFFARDSDIPHVVQQSFLVNHIQDICDMTRPKQELAIGSVGERKNISRKERHVGNVSASSVTRDAFSQREIMRHAETGALRCQFLLTTGFRMHNIPFSGGVVG